MKNWTDKLKNYPIFFISPDIKRGLGVEDLLPNYHVICSYNDPLIPVLRRYAKIFCLEEIQPDNKNLPNNSGTLLANKHVQKFIQNHSAIKPFISYFKPSLKIDYLLKINKYHALGNNYELNEKFENKINFTNVFSEIIPGFLTSFIIGRMSELRFPKTVKKFGLPFCLQFGHGWAGKTTYFISDEIQLNNLSKKFPQTVVKISPYIDGFTILNNCCLYKDKVLVSDPAVQVSGINLLSSRENVTCGRQWPVLSIDKSTVRGISRLSKIIGRQLSSSGYKGYFGIDFLIEKRTGRIFVSEINARLTASSAFFTRLETGNGLIPLLAYHYAAFLGLDLPRNRRKPLISGSQVIIREESTKKEIKLKNFGNYQITNNRLKYLHDNYQPEKLSDNQFIFHSESYPRENAELARIESKMNALFAPGKLSPWLSSLLSGKMLY
ncbi:hypothetical protein A2153_00775 [Candidatus Gottesmanbacteria bacterium RBG_16_38_7b]|uniref:ATP-grasp domain-containing protein n=1 Tax=Candidatus Gottesmanbacteria bacterium RBG_16_38_7b TaxID=1798372 RepID=A0A1F5YFH8_9BACT|nr:MAG: hypothetical protein A2153_00775 [Candidatus Gottesmanbacteria bacterium RBG_16_38_7b]